MSLHTGGTAVGDISTTSTIRSSAIFMASAKRTMPKASFSTPIRRTSGAVISPLIRWPLSVAMCCSPKSKKTSRKLVVESLFSKQHYTRLCFRFLCAATQQTPRAASHPVLDYHGHVRPPCLQPLLFLLQRGCKALFASYVPGFYR